MLNQFANEDNWKAHYNTTGEIWKDTEGTVTHFCICNGNYRNHYRHLNLFERKNLRLKLLGHNLVMAHKLVRKWPQEYLPKIFDASKVDTVIEVSETEARAMTKRLAKEEGVFAGMSSGGSVALLKIAETIESGVIVAIICDRDDRYLSSDLFE
jgi:cysteine synthase B